MILAGQLEGFKLKIETNETSVISVFSSVLTVATCLFLSTLNLFELLLQHSRGELLEACRVDRKPPALSLSLCQRAAWCWGCCVGYQGEGTGDVPSPS